MLEERQYAPGDSVPSAAELDAELGENVLVLLPEQVTESNGDVFGVFARMPKDCVSTGPMPASTSGSTRRPAPVWR